MNKFRKKLISFNNGSFYVLYKNSKYLVTKQLYSDGKIIKIYAEQLRGIDIVSGNYFLTIKGGLLKPCEMSDKKVIDFVLNLELLK
ncbi:MAG: peptide methionine sulfoxide reductase [Campylobacterota bacterium]|nr:peptide methionine sulfoxide reductase [Campylobacterota bacterium]